MNWQTEIDELHAFFEAYFLGTIPAHQIDRFAEVLDPSFTIVGPNGAESSRDETVAMVRQGHAHATDLSIRCTDHRLLLDDGVTMVAAYVEHHDWPDGRHNERRSTVVFAADPAMPNGVRWVRAHETWAADAS